MSISIHRIVVVIMTLLGIATLSARANADDCSDAAAKELKSLCGQYRSSKLEIHLDVPGSPPMADYDCAAGASTGASTSKRIVYFNKGGKALPSPPQGFSLDPGFQKWSPLVDPGKCIGLQVIVYQSGGADPNASPADRAAQARLDLAHDLFTTLHADAQTPEGGLRALHNYRARAVATGNAQLLPGTSTAAVDAAVAETLQIFGQIVVDRATAHAYDLIKDKLTELLGCKDDYTSTFGFNATCRVLLPLRIEDLAMSRDALFAAFTADALAFVQSKYPGWKMGLAPTLAAVVAVAVIELATHPQALHDDRTAKLVLDALVTYADKELSAPSTLGALTEAQKVVAVAVAAYVQCLVSPTADDPAKLLAACDVGANVDTLSGDDAAIRPPAHALAHDLVAIATPTPKGGDIAPRLIRATDVAFDTSCLVVRDTKAPLDYACNESPTIAKPEDALALMHPIAVASVRGESNAIIASIVHALQVGNSTLAARDHRRAFVLIGGILDYAETYVVAPAPSSSAPSAASTAAHDQRTKILESLTKSMTERTGREGDTVVSFGGALRLVGGARIGLRSPGGAFYGPIGLPLGLAITHLPTHDAWCHCGIHLQFDAVDIGQYVAYDQRPVVKTPELADALSPSVTVGLAWGASMPFVVGVTGGYSPQFTLDPERPDAKGTFNIGAVLGVHVPLIDVN